MLKNTVFASEISSQNILKLINQERSEHNLQPLKENHKLKIAADKKTESLLKYNYFSHTSPEGKRFFKWIEEADYQYLYAGENLAMDFMTAEGIVDAWMKSKSHRENILSDKYTETAISVKAGIFKDHPTIMVSQIFGRPKISEKELTKNNINAIINNNKKNQGTVAGAKIKNVPLYNDFIMIIFTLFLIIINTILVIDNINFVYRVKILFLETKNYPKHKYV